MGTIMYQRTSETIKVFNQAAENECVLPAGLLELLKPHMEAVTHKHNCLLLTATNSPSSHFGFTISQIVYINQ